MLKSRVAMLSLMIVIISLNEVVAKDLERLWSYGLTSRRTNTPLISENGEHNIYGSLFAYGYSIVIDGKGRRLHPSGRPLEGGEQLLRTSNYQNDPNIRAHAQVVLIMAPIRDALLYHLEGLSYDKWKKLTRPLTLNGIKIGSGEMGKVSRLLLKKWSDNVGLDIESQIREYGKEVANLNSDAPTPYQFKKQ